MLVPKLGKFLRPYFYTITLNKRFKWSKANAKYFSDLFDMSSDDAKVYRHDKKIPHLTKDQLAKKAALFNEIGITPAEWLKYPILFRESSVTLEQQYLQLKEAGFRCVNAEVLSNYHKCRRKTISLLKAYSFLDENANVAENFISYLNPRQENFLINDIIKDECILEDVHHKILTRYLAWKLNTTQDIIKKFYRVTSFKSLKSFKHICESLNLLEDIGYTSDDILKHGYLIQCSPSNLKAVLYGLPDIAGMPTEKALRLYPRIVGKPLNHYVEIYSILNNANIPDECIQNHMEIFTMKPEILKLRVEELLSVEELRVLVNSPGILRVIRSYSNARSRLSFLQDVKFKCLTTTLLSKPSANFTAHVRNGKDITNITEVVALLYKLLNSTNKAIKANLRKHPYYCYVPLLEIEESCNCLKELRLSNETIINVIQIVLYPSDKIRETYRIVKELAASKERNISPTQNLNLMLYFLEKYHHFSGNGIWRNREEHT